MHKWTVRAARLALVAAAISAAGAGVANADNTSGDYSILGGEQIHIPIIAPIGLFGNHVNLLSSGVPMGYRLAAAPAAPAAFSADDVDPGPQLDICGNAISNSNGVGTATCKGQATFGDNDAAPVAPAMHAWAAPQVSVGAPIGAPAADIGAPGRPIDAVAPAVAPASAPVAAPAAAPAIAPAIAPATAPAMAPEQAPPAAPEIAPPAAPEIAPPMAPEQAPPAAVPPAATMEAPAAAPAPEMVTSGDNGVLSGNQVKAPVHIPVRICGNAGALGGTATAACEGTAASGRFASTHAFHTLGLGRLLG